MKKEIWKPVVGYEGLYIVSNYGHVRSLDRYTVQNNNGTISKHFYKGVELKCKKNKQGYFVVKLSKNGKAEHPFVHRLVAEAFLPNPDCLPFVNHKSETKTDNFIFINQDGTVDPRKSNLEWCTAKYNANYGTRNEKISSTKKEKACKGKKIVMLSLEGKFVKQFPSAREAARFLGKSVSPIHAVASGNEHCLTAYGYKWEYA